MNTKTTYTFTEDQRKILDLLQTRELKNIATAIEIDRTQNTGFSQVLDSFCQKWYSALFWDIGSKVKEGYQYFQYLLAFERVLSESNDNIWNAFLFSTTEEYFIFLNEIRVFAPYLKPSRVYLPIASNDFANMLKFQTKLCEMFNVDKDHLDMRFDDPNNDLPF